MTDKNKDTLSPIQYGKFLQAIRQRIQSSRMMAYRAVHKELIDLYWEIGREITQRQGNAKGGAKRRRASGEGFAKGIRRIDRIFSAKPLVHASNVHGIQRIAKSLTAC
jgi:hypothetical protein